MSLRAAILISFSAHAALLGISYMGSQRSRVFTKQGFAIEILDERTALSVAADSARTDADPKAPSATNKSGAKRNIRSGVFTGSISDLMNSIVYPEQAEEMKIQGTVEIETQLDENGRAKFARIRKSSGFDILDGTAREAVLRWTFVDPPGSRLILPFRFRLEGNAENK